MKVIIQPDAFAKKLICRLTRALTVAGFLLGATSSLLTQAQTSDDVVRFAADVAGLPLIATNRQTAPRFGTFWLPPSPDSSGWLAPYPALPDWVTSDSAGNLNVYALPDGGLLVDTPDGTNVWARLNSISNTIQHAESLAATAQSASTMTALDAAGAPLPGGTNTSGTNTFNPLAVTNPPVDYSSNLYVARWTLTNGVIVGAASNTLNVEYEWLTNDDLATTNWGHSGWTFYGSDVTNWTAFPALPASATTNLFFRLLSYVSDDGSGIPTWWEELYGIEGVDPNAESSAQDGWSYYQKYEMNVAPSVFMTPPAPQGVTLSYHPATGMVRVSWLPSPGAVTGYTVKEGYNTTYPVSADTFSFSNNIAEDNPDLDFQWVFGPGPNSVYFQVQANYAGGDSDWSGEVALPNDEWTLSAYLIPGAQGAAYLALPVLPPNATTLQVWRMDATAGYIYGDDASTNFTIPVSAVTNGLYPLPAWTLAAATDAYATNMNADFNWFVDAFDANGKQIATAPVGGDYSDDGAVNYANGGHRVAWTVPPYFDGRAQLKQNLAFLFRAASAAGPFQGNDNSTNQAAYVPQTGGYLCASFYAFDSNILPDYDNHTWALNAFWPFQNNYRFLNFAFDSSYLNPDGSLATGVNAYLGMSLNDPVTYQFYAPLTPGGSLPAVLSASQSVWISSEYIEYVAGGGNYGDDGFISDYNGHFTLGGSNYWGLPFRSVKLAAESSNEVVTTLVTAGDSINAGSYYPYLNAAPPELQTAEYDFWNPDYGYWDENHAWHPLDPLPGQADFSPTNPTDNHLIVGVGSSIQVAGYAKEALLNGYAGVYGYLGQYFDNAYQVDTNGNTTTTPTGIFSPYGSFFATQPGQAALVTMPDPDTGERGTGIVYAVSLTVDHNHDGTMDTYFAGPDAATYDHPFIFWCDNNFDRWATNSPYLGLFYTDVEQDDQEIAYYPGTYTVEPDCDYTNDFGQRAIPCTRDLEDFARLWVNGITTNLLAALPTNSTITLSWGDVDSPNPGNPTIDLFTATDADGGIGYLTNETAALNQVDLTDSTYIGRIAPGQSVQLNKNQLFQFDLPYNWQGNHYIWCGVSNGAGGLTLTIADGDGNVLAQNTIYIQIKDIKQMYERWTVGDKSDLPPTEVPSLLSEGLAGTPAFQYPPPITNTTYILHAHGWNMPMWLKDRYAETEFKRLYWQGYQGRFGAFDWPAYTGGTTYNPSEFQAWRSAPGLLNLLTKLNNEYPGQVYLTAHSMGNVVAGEALRLATTQVVNTYIAMQGAISAHCYDPSTPDYATYTPPDCYANYWTNGAPGYFNGSAGAGTYVNFYNTNDYALNKWLDNQYFKPGVGYSYDPASDLFYRGSLLTDPLYFPTNTCEIFAYADPSWSYALGAQADVGGVFSTNNQVNLPSIWPPDPSGKNYTYHVWHSMEFRSDNPQLWLFWNQVIAKMRLNSN